MGSHLRVALALCVVALWAAPGMAAACNGTLVLPSLFFSPILNPSSIPRWVNRLVNPLSPSFAFVPLRTNASNTSDVYRIGMRRVTQQMLPVGCPRTPVFAYGNADDPLSNPRSFSAPGRTIFARSGRPTVVHWVHTQLPHEHLLPIDRTLHCGITAKNCSPDVRTVPHLHGGHIAWEADGFPEAWKASSGETGPLFSSDTYVYDNDQESATLWYHDHAPGITRLNVYAGLAGLYVIRDAVDFALQMLSQVPAAPYDVALVVQDRYFYPNGSLAYPDTPPWAPFRIHNMLFGNVFVVNGAAWPRWPVEPRAYRVRLVNGCNSRFLALRFVSTLAAGGTTLPVAQIASDGGFLNAAVTVTNETLVLSPGERAEYVVDFGAAKAGEEFVLTNSAASPYPTGAAPEPQMREVVRVAVTVPLDARRPRTRMPRVLRLKSFSAPPAALLPTLPTRKLVLYQTIDKSRARIVNMLGTAADGPQPFCDAGGITEQPALGATEVWEVYNPTAESHPIHLHLVQFSVIDRANIAYVAGIITRGALNYTVQPGEQGPKDTVRVDPGTVVRLVATFDRAGLYVWHCHMLEHEDSDMMRPLCVGGDCRTDWLMDHDAMR
jgi:spore coat protein A, manganese oxidase